MSGRSQSSAGLLPVHDRYGLWALSLRKAVSGTVRARTGNRHPLEVLGVAVASVILLAAFDILMARAGLSPFSRDAAADFSLWNLPFGFGLGILLGYGLGYLPVLLLAFVIAPYAAGVSAEFPLVVAQGSGQVLVLGLGVLSIQWLAQGPVDDLTQRRTFVGFIVSAPFIAVLGTLITLLTDMMLDWPSGFPAMVPEFVAVSFWGNLLGILLIAPFAMMTRRCLASWLGFRRRRQRPGEESSRPHWPYLWRAGIVAMTFAASVYLVLSYPFTNELWYFGVVSVPLWAAAWGFGLWGVAPVLGAMGLAAVARIELGFEPLVTMQLPVVMAAANGSVTGLFVTERRRYQGTMNHQAALMDSVSFATEQLLGITDQEKNVTGVLQHLADEAHLERVYVLENRHSARDSGFPVLYELGPELDEEHRARVVALRGKHMRKNAGLLEDGIALELTATDLSPEDRGVLRAAGIEGMLVLPVFADGRWWGCLGLDQNSDVRGWSRPDIATFEATARVLGALLAHTNVEQQFRQFTGSIPVVFWIASPDILHKTYVSPAYEQIWGRPRDGIRENPRSWMAAIYHDDYARVSQVLEGNPHTEFAAEYRIVHEDRSVRWIRDTGFPVVDASGEVNRIVGIAQDITSQKEAEERLRASEDQIRTSLNEKEVLLKEIHHRVKNNLQVISSLLSLQAGQIRDSAAVEVFRDSQYRVRAMALVHERLYQSDDLARIDFAGYVQDMTSHLVRSYQGESRGIQLVSNVRGVSLDVDAAIPCALIINELVSNSLKYAFPKGKRGEISVSLSEVDGTVLMTIGDDGIGLPDGTSFETSKSLGLQLVHSLTDQLGGTVVCQTHKGTQFEIRFPLTSSPS